MPVAGSDHSAYDLCPVGPAFAWHHVRLASELKDQVPALETTWIRKMRRPSRTLWHALHLANSLMHAEGMKLPCGALDRLFFTNMLSLQPNQSEPTLTEPL
jgi:hypothetical protein